MTVGNWLVLSSLVSPLYLVVTFDDCHIATSQILCMSWPCTLKRCRQRCESSAYTVVRKRGGWLLGTTSWELHLAVTAILGVSIPRDQHYSLAFLDRDLPSV